MNSRDKATWDVEKGDYLWDGHTSHRVERIERDRITGRTRVTLSNGTVQERGKYEDYDFDTWEENR